MDPKTLRFAPTHEWAALQGGNVVVGISKFAVEQLTDVVFIDLPKVGEKTTKGESFGEIESVKAVSDLYAPVDGQVVEINKKLVDDPASISADPFGDGWLIKIKPTGATSLDHLLTHEQYEKQIAEEGH